MSDHTPVPARRDPVPASYAEAMTVGNTLAASGFFADAKDGAQAAAKVIAGMELGIGPMAAMAGIYIVKGKVTLGANLIGGQIKRSGRYDFRVTRLDDTGCVIEFYDRGERIGESSFTDADAKAAGLWGGQGPWKQHPRNMLYARAMSNGAKWYCPDVFAGPVYTPDELGAPSVEAGEVIVAPAEPEPTDDQQLARERAQALLEAGPREVVTGAMREAGIASADLHDDATFAKAREAVVAAVEGAE